MITALLLLVLAHPNARWADRPQPGHRVPMPAVTDAPRQPWGQRQRRRFFPPVNFYSP